MKWIFFIFITFLLVSSSSYGKNRNYNNVNEIYKKVFRFDYSHNDVIGVGVAYFISKDGYALTAKHTFDTYLNDPNHKEFDLKIDILRNGAQRAGWERNLPVSDLKPFENIDVAMFKINPPNEIEFPAFCIPQNYKNYKINRGSRIFVATYGERPPEQGIKKLHGEASIDSINFIQHGVSAVQNVEKPKASIQFYSNGVAFNKGSSGGVAIYKNIPIGIVQGHLDTKDKSVNFISLLEKDNSSIFDDLRCSQDQFKTITSNVVINDSLKEPLKRPDEINMDIEINLYKDGEVISTGSIIKGNPNLHFNTIDSTPGGYSPSISNISPFREAGFNSQYKLDPSKTQRVIILTGDPLANKSLISAKKLVKEYEKESRKKPNHCYFKESPSSINRCWDKKKYKLNEKLHNSIVGHYEESIEKILITIKNGETTHLPLASIYAQLGLHQMRVGDSCESLKNYKNALSEICNNQICSQNISNKKRKKVFNYLSSSINLAVSCSNLHKQEDELDDMQNIAREGISNIHHLVSISRYTGIKESLKNGDKYRTILSSWLKLARLATNETRLDNRTIELIAQKEILGDQNVWRNLINLFPRKYTRSLKYEPFDNQVVINNIINLTNNL